MSKRNRVFFGVVLAYLIGVGFLMYTLLGQIDPRYRESAEESLVETSQLLASLVETQMLHDGAIDPAPLEPLFKSVYARSFSAQIFSLRKERVELRITVTDASGRVLFDSRGRAVGEDHSKWRDVALTLDGRYGARTSADVPDHPHSSVMYVGAPVRWQDRIVGVVSVGKPVQSFGQFVEAARRKTLLVGAYSVAATLVFMLILTVWLVRPFGIVEDYGRYLRSQRKRSLPRLARSAAGLLRGAFDEMRDALAGRTYVADYVQTLTHELKSPLSAIRGASELLQEPGMDEADRRRFLANIARETQRIQELVDRMMELAAVESRRHLAAVAPVALGPLVEEVAASARAIGAARGIAVRYETPAAPAVVEGDAFLLRRAITNLVDNALDFSPDGGEVHVEVEPLARTVEVRVRDHGPGVPPYAAGRVFEKFYSLARPGTRKKSTGLGLAFVKEVADLHRARVTLANAPDGSGALAVFALRREP